MLAYFHSTEFTGLLTVGRQWRLTGPAKCLSGESKKAEGYFREFEGYFLEYVGPKELESFVRGRIVALVGYIYSLQEK